MTEKEWLFGKSNRRTRRVTFHEPHYQSVRYRQIIESLDMKEQPERGDLMFVLLAVSLVACMMIEMFFGGVQ